MSDDTRIQRWVCRDDMPQEKWDELMQKLKDGLISGDFSELQTATTRIIDEQIIAELRALDEK